MPRPRRKNRSPEEVESTKMAILDALDAGSSTREAMQSAGVTSWRSVYEWREEDPEFEEAWQLSLRAGTARVERELMRYAVDDLSQPGAVTSAIFLLKSRMPHVYGDRQRIETVSVDVQANEAMNEAMSDWLKSNPDKHEAVMDFMAVAGEHDA